MVFFSDTGAKCQHGLLVRASVDLQFYMKSKCYTLSLRRYFSISFDYRVKLSINFSVSYKSKK